MVERVKIELLSLSATKRFFNLLLHARPIIMMSLTTLSFMELSSILWRTHFYYGGKNYPCDAGSDNRKPNYAECEPKPVC